jgi:hypothetical protein
VLIHSSQSISFTGKIFLYRDQKIKRTLTGQRTYKLEVTSERP